MTTSALTFDLLEWIASGPRSYDETIEAWKTSCPHLSIWDDAVTDGLVAIVSDGTVPARVTLTESGEALLPRVR